MLRGPSESLELVRHFVQNKTLGYDSKTFCSVKGIDDLEAIDFFTMNTRETRGHGMKLRKQTSMLLSISHRVVDDWNSLPRKVVEARDLNAKRRAP